MSRHRGIDHTNRRAFAELLAALLVWARPHGDEANRAFWAAWDAGASADKAEAAAREAVEALRVGEQLTLGGAA